MEPSRFFSGVEQTDLPFEQHVFKSPFFIREASGIGAFFLCDFEWAARLVTSPWRPLKLPFNKALFSIACIEYKDTDIGPYNEVALTIAVRPPGKFIRRTVESLKSVFKRRFHAYVLHLPVTTEISVAGGRGLLKYPKFMADITFRETGTHRICTLRDRATLGLILEFDSPRSALRSGRIPLLRRLRPLQGRLSVDTAVAGVQGPNASFMLNIPASGQSLVWPRARLRWGRHEIAEQLRGLNIGAQVGQFSVPVFEGMLSAGEALREG